MYKVIVTGCGGFIGWHIAMLLLKEGHMVYGIDSCTYASNRARMLKLDFENYKLDERLKRYTFEQCDIRELHHLPECDFVINCAAETHVDNSLKGSAVFMDSNIGGVYKLLELIRGRSQYGMPTFIQFSTDEVYGDSNVPHTEESLLRPSNPYAATKAAADQLINAWGRTYNMPYIILRPSNNYGEGQFPEKLIPKAIANLLQGKKIPLHLKGTPFRTWLHVEDTARAVLSLLKWLNSKPKSPKPKSPKPIQEIFNISGDILEQNIDVVSRLIRAVHGTSNNLDKYIEWGYERPGADLTYRLNDNKFRYETGWKPEVTDFDKALGDIVSYETENNRILEWVQ